MMGLLERDRAELCGRKNLADDGTVCPLENLGGKGPGRRMLRVVYRDEAYFHVGSGRRPGRQCRAEYQRSGGY